MNTTTQRTAFRTAVAGTVLAGAVAVPSAAFAADTAPAPTGQVKSGGTRPAGARTVDIGGGVEAEIKDGKAYLKEIGSGKVFAVLAKGQSYTDGIYVHFDGTNVTARTQGDSEPEKKAWAKPGGAKKADAKPGGAKPDSAKPDGATFPKGGVAAGEAPRGRTADTDPALIGGALAAAGVLGGAGVLVARRRRTDG
ncbi:hypothetical protein [Streptomyces sp. UNOB3_S3]|uniref:hypothetical protein n=1 Tax=Streptomyces sp. UNOB3_S3 TaxID=2871682 RepID=UPI001E62FBF4|nr:hypothetical protein [Streptomyces sp. UNOB3_S3]MCC3773611.1 hypothetical protein [Streptomyces sp. UNOB3_S3]